MTKRVTFEELGRWCRSAGVARSWLGPLAPWLMQPEHRLVQPQLLDRVGAVHLLLVARRPDETQAVLAPGFVLPCLWCAGGLEPSRLPQKLVALSRRVAELAKVPGFTLQLDPRLEPMDLGGLEVEVESCFAPLYAALVLASLGAQPAPGVFATGQELDGSTLGAVQGIEAKLGAVHALRLERAVVFVPAGNLQRAREVVRQLDASIDVRPYPVSEPSLARTMAPHLAQLDVPPQRLPDNLQVRLDWANRDYRLFLPERTDFYLEHLVHDLAARLAEDPCVARWPVRSLALAVSFNWSLVVLLVHALRPQRLLLLHSPETERHQASIERAISGVPSVLQHVEVVEPGESSALELLEPWLAEQGRSAVEVTGGTKAMSVLLTVAAQRSGAELLYLRHEVRNGRFLFGTESFRALDWARDGGAC